MEQFEAVLADAAREGVQGLYISRSPFFFSSRVAIASLVAHARLPAVYAFREFAVAGGLLSYAASLSDIYQRAAGTVDKFLKGTNPGDIPIERPTRFELVVNLKTAKALGSDYPRAFLLCRRSDRIATLFAAVRMSPIGTKRTSRPDCLMSAFGGKADMAFEAAMSANDPKRTSASISYCSSDAGSAPIKVLV